MIDNPSKSAIDKITGRNAAFSNKGFDQVGTHTEAFKQAPSSQGHRGKIGARPISGRTTHGKLL